MRGQFIAKPARPRQIRLLTVLVALPLLLALCLLVAGCRKMLDPDEPRQVTIAAYNSAMLKLFLLPALETRYPEWQFDVVPLYDDSFYQLKEPDATRTLIDSIEQDKPDLVVLPGSMYRPLADGGALRDLEEWISRDEVDMGAFVPGVIEWLKANEEEKLYGLSPSFRTSILYYNKTMFKNYGIEEPHDRMTWAEVLALANRFTQDAALEEGAYGLYEIGIQSPYDMLSRIGETEGLQMLDFRTGKILTQSDEWTRIWDMVANAFGQGSLGAAELKYKMINGEKYIDQEHMKAMDLFSQGKTAMTLGQDDLMKRLKSAPPPFDWGVYSGPVSSRDAQKVGWFTIDDVFAIPAASSQPDAMWEAIKYIHSENMGKLYASTDRELFVMKDYPVWKNDSNYEVFYAQRGWAKENDYRTSVVPSQFYEPFIKLVNDFIDATIAGEATADQALAQVQTEGQEMLDKMRATTSK